jgi:hypothetical protein
MNNKIKRIIFLTKEFLTFSFFIGWLILVFYVL